MGLIYILFVSSLIFAIPLEKFNENITLSELLKLQFPKYSWLAYLTGFSIFSAIAGTLHALIWSSSMLIISLLKKTHSVMLRTFAVYEYNTFYIISLVGIIVCACAIFFKSQDLFFSLTAIFIVFAYVCSMLTILFKHASQNKFYTLISIAGLFTAAIILLYATDSLIGQIKATPRNLTTNIK